MQVDRHAQADRAFQDGPEVRVVQVAATAVAVDDRAGEPQLADGPGQLVGGLSRRRGRDGGEAGQPGRVRSYRRGERVVAAPGQRDGLFGGELLDAGGGQGQHGEVDTAGVHRRDPARSESSNGLTTCWYGSSQRPSLAMYSGVT
nr:hypothetical protein [Fodinicola feengrottensis]